MAKRKGMKRKGSKTKKYRVYARKVGSVSLQDVAVALGGAVIGRFGVNMIGKAIPQIIKTPASKSIAQIGLGFLIKPVAGLVGSKSAMVDSFAKGVMIGGGYELMKTAVPAAFGAAEGDDVIVVNGTDISEINGMDDIGMDISEINGMDDIGYYNIEDFNE
jgi:hypothetical protein